MLVEQSKKNKWLAEQLNKNQSTVSQWCNNARQPSLYNLLEIKNAIGVNINETPNSSRNIID